MMAGLFGQALVGVSLLWSSMSPKEEMVFRREIVLAVGVGCEGDGINVPTVAMTN
jgi:hypothetical protein